MEEDRLLSNAQWKRKLTPEQYHLLHEKGTERPFSGALLHEKRNGKYHCAACGARLFASDTKFDSETGWPSFDEALPGVVELHDNDTHGMHRVEITCATCESHVGHLFSDGPTQTGMRYCTNSMCLSFDVKE